MQCLSVRSLGATTLFFVTVGCGGNGSTAWYDRLSSADIGDASRGAELFESKNCSDCHMYDGRGTGEGPSLDYMRGSLAASDIADMGGAIWNHMPHMIEHFAEEGIPMPTFEGNEMADLIAYLHGGPPDTTTSMPPAGHTGGKDIPADAIGDPSVGQALFQDRGCASCHSYGGVGGDDAPALDFLAGHLSATEIANMSGRLWNDIPSMLVHFEHEGIPVPVFADGEMADLVAYLHGGVAEQ